MAFRVKNLMIQTAADRVRPGIPLPILGEVLRDITIAAECGCTCSCTCTASGGGGCGCTCSCTCTGSSGDLGSLGRPGDLEVLKDALRKAIERVERHEESLKPQTIEEVRMLEGELTAALKELEARRAELERAGQSKA